MIVAAMFIHLLFGDPTNRPPPGTVYVAHVGMTISAECVVTPTGECSFKFPIDKPPSGGAGICRKGTAECFGVYWVDVNVTGAVKPKRRAVGKP